MKKVINFFDFKYNKDYYYMDLFINRNALFNIERALEERLCNVYMTKDEEYAYMKLKKIFETSRESTENKYAEVRINMCFVKYIKNLDHYFTNKQEYMSLRVLNEYLKITSIDETDRINNFNLLNEDIRLDILSRI